MMRTNFFSYGFLALSLCELSLSACGGAQTASQSPSALAATRPALHELPADSKLPSNVRPIRYQLELNIDPTQATFSGDLHLQLIFDEPSVDFFVHGSRMTIASAELSQHRTCRPQEEGCESSSSIAATVEETTRDGWLHVTLDRAVSGSAELHIVYSAPFDRQLKGLYRVDRPGESYAFTQFEATSARYAFPSFDEPRFKTPFEIIVTTPEQNEVIGNTETHVDRIEDGVRRVVFAPTLPLPTYLVALAVGPLDVVEGVSLPPTRVRDRSIPFRAVAARGKGPLLAHALANTRALLEAIEEYTGIAYPYSKLDIIAVPDFAGGAMENAGAITFREELLLLTDRAPQVQVRGFSNVMAHELAHQWFGDLVTMPWWDDIWLNEAFATWMATKAVESVFPEQQSMLSRLDSTHMAMDVDVNSHARAIRQAIVDEPSIRNAFDAITYQKGAAVLAMFEHALGEENFRRAIHRYLEAHAFGTATSADLYAAFQDELNVDVGARVQTFTDQAGVPAVSAQVRCEDGQAMVVWEQSRFVRSQEAYDGQPVWSIPVCAHFGDAARDEVACMDLLGARAEQRLNFCPTWIHPNADGNGYYRLTVTEEQQGSLISNISRLTPRERISLADNLRASALAGKTSMRSFLDLSETLLAASERQVVQSVLSALDYLQHRILSDAERSALARRFAPILRRRLQGLGFTTRPTDAPELSLLRKSLAAFLVFELHDEPTIRAYARGTSDAELFDVILGAQASTNLNAVVERLATESDALRRQQILAAVGRGAGVEQVQQVLDLGLSPNLRVAEVAVPLMFVGRTNEGRSLALAWLDRNWDAFVARVATTRVGYLPLYFQEACSEEQNIRIEALFTPRIAELPGGAHNLENTLSSVGQCLRSRNAMVEGLDLSSNPRSTSQRPISQRRR